MASLEIDKLILIPAFLNPFKSSTFAPSELRLQWMQKIATKYKKVEISDIEIVAQKPMPSYQTIQALKLRYNLENKPYMIIGADNVSSLPQWANFEMLNESVTFVVATRKDYEFSENFLRLDVDYDISSTRLRQSVDPSALPPYLSDEIMKYYKEHHAREIR